MQADLFPYPIAPGFKVQETSKAAAKGMAPKAGTLRERVLAALREAPGTPEDVAARLNEPVMNVRPRISEARALGLVKDTGRRGEAFGGRRAIIWAVAE